MNDYLYNMQINNTNKTILYKTQGIYKMGWKISAHSKNKINNFNNKLVNNDLSYYSTRDFKKY